MSVTKTLLLLLWSMSLKHTWELADTVGQEAELVVSQAELLQTCEATQAGGQGFQKVVGHVLKRQRKLHQGVDGLKERQRGCIYQLDQTRQLSQFLRQAPQLVGLEG